MIAKKLNVGNILWNAISMKTKVVCGARFPTMSEQGLMFQINIKTNELHKIDIEPSKNLFFVRLWHIQGSLCRSLDEKDNVKKEQLDNLIDALYKKHQE